MVNNQLSLNTEDNAYWIDKWEPNELMNQNSPKNYEQNSMHPSSED